MSILHYWFSVNEYLSIFNNIVTDLGYVEVDQRHQLKLFYLLVFMYATNLMINAIKLTLHVQCVILNHTVINAVRCN